MVSGGIEAILGVTNDKLFGPAVMFGLGGIFAEVLKDVAFRIAPVTRSVALEMIAEIKGYAVLTGARGAAHADIDALAETIVRLSALAVDLKDHVAELDINPGPCCRTRYQSAVRVSEGQGCEGGGCANQAAGAGVKNAGKAVMGNG